jgi:hypothetical protein
MVQKFQYIYIYTYITAVIVSEIKILESVDLQNKSQKQNVQFFYALLTFLDWHKLGVVLKSV